MRCLVFLQWGLCNSCEERSGYLWSFQGEYYLFSILFSITKTFCCVFSVLSCKYRVFLMCLCCRTLSLDGQYDQSCHIPEEPWRTVYQNSRYVWSQFKCHVFVQTIGRLLIVQIFLSQISPVYRIPESPVRRAQELPTIHSISAVKNKS